MRKPTSLLILILIYALLGCKDKSVINNQKPKPTYNELLSLYKDISLDTLAVFSTTDDLESNKYQFKGKKIDSIYFPLFPKKIQELLHLDKVLFACYQFKINKHQIGLITRTPSEYVPSSIRLMVFDKEKMKIIQTFELAETWGDYGDSMSKDSWLYKNKKNELEWFYWRQDCWYETDSSTTGTCQDSMAVYKLLNRKIVGLELDILMLNKIKKVITKK